MPTTRPPAATPIAGLTDGLFEWSKGLLGFFRKPVQPSGEVEWRATLRRLRDCRLIDATAAWREDHRRLYEQLKTDTPHRPDGLASLQPLYQALAHGCRAGLYQEACDEVYRDRILRGTEHDGYYSANMLGAFGADLGGLACFFVEPWRRPADAARQGFAEAEAADWARPASTQALQP